MEVLFAFLNWTASFAQIDEESGSKMDSHNLATVMAPNILYANKSLGMDESFLAIEAVTSLIDYNENMCQVPEDFVSCLGDTALFKDSAEVTTKELLKRYAHYGKGTGAQKTVSIEPAGEYVKEGSGSFRSNVPVATRVDTDLHQEHAWQKQSSVRHVQQAPGGPQNNHEYHPPKSPYRERNNSQGSQGSFHQNPKKPGAVAASGA